MEKNQSSSNKCNSDVFVNVYTAEQLKKLSKEFSRLKDRHYLDHAGATLYSDIQIQSISSQLLLNLYGNPHTNSITSKLTEEAIDVVRYQILSIFSTTSNDYSVVFTSGATAALKTIGECFNYDSNGIFAYLEDNHTSVLGMRAYAERTKCICMRSTLKDLLQSLKQYELCAGNSLFVYPAQSNFSGYKYPLEWIDAIHNDSTLTGRWFVVLDAASFVSTNHLDLSKFPADFVTISFYKIFGYPTGLGALLIRNCSAHVLAKKYFGGGTVAMALTTENVMIPKLSVHKKFEDGTIDFLSILALRYGFQTFEIFDLNFDLISRHTFNLTEYIYKHMSKMLHSNQTPCAKFYLGANNNFIIERQGGILNFNLMYSNGDFVGYSQIVHYANLYGIDLRCGCFCNPGACYYFLHLNSKDVQQHFDTDHVCGDQHDLVDGHPTGSIRISFGYMSTQTDADVFLSMIRNCFLDLRQNYELNYYSDRHFLSQSYNHYTAVGQLTQIILYPIKSAGGYTLQTDKKWELIETGLRYDRHWVIINRDGVVITQKNCRKVCLIQPLIDTENDLMTLHYPAANDLIIPLNYGASSSICQSKIYNNKIQGWDCGNKIGEWLSGVLHYPGLRLIRQSNDNNNLSFVNKAQFLLINTASVHWLRDKITDQTFVEPFQTTVERFRPNIIVNFQVPFVENEFSVFSIGTTIQLVNVGKCTRCQMICINQKTANFNKEPLQTLSREFKGKISFGAYLNLFQTAFTSKHFIQCNNTVIASRKNA